MGDLTHAERDWCVLPTGHEGRCLADWEKKHEDHKAMFRSFRGRRYIACNAIRDLESVIDHLGDETGKTSVYIDPPLPAPPSDQVKAELKNMTTVMLRLLLILNDGNVSSSKLNSF